jgi:hypothetical protein
VENFYKTVENLWRVWGNTSRCCGKGVEFVGKTPSIVKNCKFFLVAIEIAQLPDLPTNSLQDH